MGMNSICIAFKKKCMQFECPLEKSLPDNLLTELPALWTPTTPVIYWDQFRHLQKQMSVKR
jgi:hypothetical protein